MQDKESLLATAMTAQAGCHTRSSASHQTESITFNLHERTGVSMNLKEQINK